MKKLVILFLAVIFACSLCTQAFAANGVDLNCAYTIKDGDRVFVKISVVDIADSTGVSVVDYLIKYDDSVLKLQKANVNLPEKWSDFVEDEMAENLSQVVNGGFRWSVVNAMAGYGITEDDQLFVELEFTRLSNISTDIEVIYKAVANDNIEEIYGPSETISIWASAENSESSESSEPESDVSESSSPESNESNESVTDIPESSEPESDSVDIEFSTYTSDSEESDETESTEVNDAVKDEDEKTSDVWMIILGIVGGIVVIVGIVYFVLVVSKKGKK